METFTEIKSFVNNPIYQKQREKVLSNLDINTIDAPINEMINDFTQIPYCFTLQSCYGHFVHKYQRNKENLEPLPNSLNIAKVEYRIAYLAICIQNRECGKTLFQGLKALKSIDPDYIQFGCAEWFWKKQVNSYVLQVEPDRYKTQDRVTISFQEALHVETIRNEVFNQLKKIIFNRNTKEKNS